MLDVVIFSKDRACQLDLLLNSIERRVADWREWNIQVLYTFSTPAFGTAYDEVWAAHPGFRYVCERDRREGFRELTLALVGERPYVTFLVDDDVFKEDFSVDMPEFRTFASDPSIMCLSLRMCPRMDYAYTLDRHTAIPPFEQGTVWDWNGGDGDWGYPMSIDGHIFRSAELVPLMAELEFRDPNTFEDVLSRHPLPHPRVICFEESKLINLPVNRVQDTAPNRHGGVAAQWLNDEFLAGRRLALRMVEGVRNPSPHHELPLLWEPDSHDAQAGKPRVSVVIPCYNAARHLAETVQSVLAQTLGERELIIVDDGSDDDTVAIAQGLIDAHPEASIRLLRQPRSGHPANPRNAGIAHARGEYILCLDADDLLTPRFLELCVQALDTRPDVSIAFTEQQDFGAGERHHAVSEYDFRALTDPTGSGTHRSSVARRGRPSAGSTPTSPTRTGISGSAAASTATSRTKVHGTEWRYRVSDDGRFATDGIPKDRRTRAQLVLKRPGLYTPGQREWAQAVLDGDSRADLVADQLWVIPEVEALPAAPSPLSPPTDSAAAATPQAARSFVTVALAEEAISHPDLITAYGEWFGAHDDATLVLYAPDADPVVLGERLASVASAASLDSPESPEVMALAVPADAGAEALLGSAHALLTDNGHAGPLDRLPRFGSQDLAGLRERADRIVTGGPPPLVITLGTRTLEVGKDMEWAYANGAHYERNVVERFRRAVTAAGEGATVFDIGANCGYFSVLACELGAPAYSFEPVPGTFDVLRRNRVRNEMGAEGAFCMALGAEAGIATMHLYSSSGNNSLYERTLPPDHPLRLAGTQPVTVSTLDDCIERFELRPPSVIKMDVEGAELDVLRGARRTLQSHHPVVILEYAETTCADAGYAREALVDELLALGYNVWGLSEDPDDDTLHPLDTPARTEIGTLVAAVDVGRLGSLGAPEAVAAVTPAPVPRCVAHHPPGWDWYVRDLAAYRELPGGAGVSDADLMPKLDDKTPGNPYDGHYFFQDVWAARRVAERRPVEHVDVGSRVDYVGFLTAITKVVFVDIRPLDVDIDGLRCVTGSILEMPFADRSLESVSCLHVAEHIGLGRYGDPLNPNGTVEAAAELQRVVAPGGQLLFAVPVGRERTCFNAHRIFDPRTVPAMFGELGFVEFAGVDDSITFRRHRAPEELAGSNYACGMYLFRRPL